jgi:hypothetical protein
MQGQICSCYARSDRYALVMQGQTLPDRPCHEITTLMRLNIYSKRESVAGIYILSESSIGGKKIYDRHIYDEFSFVSYGRTAMRISAHIPSKPLKNHLTRHRTEFGYVKRHICDNQKTRVSRLRVCTNRYEVDMACLFLFYNHSFISNPPLFCSAV